MCIPIQIQAHQTCGMQEIPSYSVIDAEQYVAVNVMSEVSNSIESLEIGQIWGLSGERVGSYKNTKQYNIYRYSAIYTEMYSIEYLPTINYVTIDIIEFVIKLENPPSLNIGVLEYNYKKRADFGSVNMFVNYKSMTKYLDIDSNNYLFKGFTFAEINILDRNVA